MNFEAISSWAKEIADEQGFVIEEEIYRGIYYQQDHLRNIIYAGTFNDKPAVLKVYNDPRFTNEVSAHRAFLDANKSRVLRAPELYASKEIDEHKGWLIMELLRDGTFLKAPLPKDERSQFLDFYREYRIYFPKKPHRPLLDIEKQTADVYHQLRLKNWKEHFTKVDMTRSEPFLTKQLENTLSQARGYIQEVYTNQGLEWGHRHFKPQEIFYKNDETWYLTDFAHTSMTPKGYELAFLIWADQMMTQSPLLPYDEWKQGIMEWQELLQPLLEEQGLSPEILRAALAERMLGTILMDYGSSDKPNEEIQAMMKTGQLFLEEILS